MSATVSTIIVNYNAGSLLRGCVESLLQCPLNIEIIVVDNASTDGSLDALAGLPVQIIRNDYNAGFAAACNAGVNAASAPYLLFLNPDTYFSPGALTCLLDALRSDEQTGMAGGLLINPDGTEQGGGAAQYPRRGAPSCAHSASCASRTAGPGCSTTSTCTGNPCPKATSRWRQSPAHA